MLLANWNNGHVMRAMPPLPSPSLQEPCALPTIAGVDEVGRGPLAGPVVAAAVLLEPRDMPLGLMDRIADSKTLNMGQRTEIAAALQGCCVFALGWADVAEIETWNILGATHLAMARAIKALGTVPGRVLIDGNSAPALPCPCECIVGGDASVPAIAAASIVAKVARDRHMEVLAESCPGYGWERNRGYGTPEHLDALRRLGVNEHHRRSFKPVREALAASR